MATVQLKKILNFLGSLKLNISKNINYNNIKMTYFSEKKDKILV